MNDTQKRIAEYKQLLPGLKERIVAVALLLVISLTMVTTTTFAWLVLSRSPQLSGVTTTIAANGNLEIALVNGTTNDLVINAPGASKVGDSNLNLVERNLTWGNLINLSDPVYGLDNLTLRPAQLNTASLNSSPLYGATFSADGRIEKLSSNFGFATWVPPTDGVDGYFKASDSLGVRAISSMVSKQTAGFAYGFTQAKDAAMTANNEAKNKYIDIMDNQAWMNSLATVIGTFMTAKLNSNNPTVSSRDVENLHNMFTAFKDVYAQEQQALVTLANFQLFVKNKGGELYGGTPYVPFTVESLFAYDPEDNTKFDYTLDDLSKMGVQISPDKNTKIADGRQSFLDDFNTVISVCDQLAEIKKQGTVYWDDIKGFVEDFVDVGKCYIDMNDNGKQDSGEAINSIGKSAAAGMLGKEYNAVISNGILLRFEERTGARMKVEKMKISVTYMITASVTAKTVKTSAEGSLFEDDVQFGVSSYEANGGTSEMVAQDTYGLAIDFWVRTNAIGHYLVLEGNVLTEKTEVVATGYDLAGNVVELYTLAVSETSSEGETITYTVELYKDSDGVYYDAHTHEEFDIGDGTPNKKIEIVETVIGYEGDNRVWDENAGLSVNSTTQGSGSCYVYYADTPEDQARSLNLLSAMNVAFVDQDGYLLATAYMDTEHHYADNGKVTVPLVLSADSVDLGTDLDGDSIYAITALERNVPIRITALVYLDGTDLDNSDVLAAATIQGQLNIQFGAYTDDLEHAENEKLETQEITASASVDKTAFDFDKATEPMITNVSVRVDTIGDQPKTVTAFFIRQISSTQGSREKSFSLSYDEENNVWTAPYEFLTPGVYILRSVQLDGIEYDLAQRPSVTVSGFALEYLNMKGNSNVMTASGSTSVDLDLKFVTNDPDKLPRTVQGRFLREDGTAASITFAYNATTGVWSGKATFVSSGEYVLQHLVLDNEYFPISAEHQKFVKVYLGMKVAVYTSSPTEFVYEGSSMPDDQKSLHMSVKIMDNTGTEMTGLTGVKLYYTMKGSMISEAGLEAGLDWTGTYYEGDFQSKVGMFEFMQVVVGDSVITKATTAPSFVIMSPEPPTFHSDLTKDYYFNPDPVVTATTPVANPAYFSVNINHLEAATSVKAIIAEMDANGNKKKEHEVDGYILVNLEGTDYTTWAFTVPIIDDKQDGYWKLTEIRIAGVYDEDGNQYTASNPLVFTVADGIRNEATKVVTTVKVSFAQNDGNTNKHFGKENLAVDGTVTGQFMDTYNIEGVNVSITDWEGAPIRNVQSVTMTYDYDGLSEKHGGYSSNALLAKDGIETITLDTISADKTTYTQSSTATNANSAVWKVQYAGGYSPSALTIKVKVSDTATKTYSFSKYTMPDNAPVFTVSSKKPTVTISSVSSNVSTDRYYTSSTPSSLSVITGSYNKRIDDYNAIVYMYISAQSGALDQEQVVIKYPTVTLSLTGIPTTHSGVTMVFPGSNNTSSTFSFAAGGTAASSTIGAGVDGTFSEGILGIGAKVEKWPVFYPAGKQSVNTITVTYGGNTYTVTLSDTVTINNPLCPAFADFNSTASGQTLPTTPSRIYGTPQLDGTFTITLPGTQTWTEAKSSTSNGTFTVQSGYPTTRNVYTQRTETSGCNSTTYYTPYIETTTVSKATSSTTTWTRTWMIIGWKVGNTTYGVGETISVTGPQTVTAVLSYTDGTKTTASSTTTRTEIAYTKNGNESTTRPSGTRVDNVTGSSTDVVS